MYLKHKDTAKWLSMNGKRYPNPIAGQHEVAATGKKDASAAWLTSEGVYFSPPEATSSQSTAEKGGATGGGASVKEEL